MVDNAKTANPDPLVCPLMTLSGLRDEPLHPLMTGSDVGALSRAKAQ